ncbi:MAG TPA: hypothetical protein VF174_01180 [Micromonosporaceae bacterium]
MDAADLRRAYDVLLAEAEAGGFDPPPPGRWNAEQVIAHVAANDELMAETTEAVLAGSPWVSYNHNTIHRAQLDEMIAESGGMPGLIPLLRDRSERLCRLVERLGDRSSTLVDTHMRDGFELVIDEQLPWGRTIDIHGRLHLPIHIAQLRALRRDGGSPGGP